MYDLSAATAKLPSDFIFGVATAAFQIEGATHEDGRTDSIWDTFCRTPGKVKNGDTGEPACDHYHRWPQDLDLIRELGFDAYRLSVSWARVMPEPGVINAKGLDFYVRLIDGLCKRGIAPWVTLYHWDMPQWLEDRGGWLNRESAWYFAQYAEAVGKALGNKVAGWCTLNEPFCSAYLGYRWGIHAPGRTGLANGLAAAHHLLLAHGLSVPRLREAAPDSKVGITLNFTPGYPVTPMDQGAVEVYNAENGYWFLEPLMTGHYPSIVAKLHAHAMPRILAEDAAILQAPLDFLGINYYSRALVKQSQDPDKLYDTVPAEETGGELTDIGWEIYPTGLRDLLLDLQSRYNPPPMYITENGAACADVLENGEVQDEQRCRYYRHHLAAVGEALEGGADVRGYFCWSLMDNFEWAEGYSKRFGLVHVDYDTQLRTPKASAQMFARYLKQRNR
ncbi:MAG: beta-glucosidase [Gammaproteobacteria bacterium]|nr:MAG: beta-glucosidase [Gammaproteobacteria bacterium]